jgi:tetratricopeptide (TPR) repeat protein
LNGLAGDDGMAWACHNLGVLYKSQGKLSEAEQMYQRALHGYEKALGPNLVYNFLPALNTIQNLAVLYSDTRRPSEARDMYLRTLPGLKMILGSSSSRYQRILTAIECLGHDQGTPLRTDRRIKSKL